MQMQGRILLVTHKGTLNGSMVQFFSDNLEDALGDIKGSPWGYLSHSTEASIATQDFESLMMESGLKALEWGCVGAAYLIKSPVLLAQTSKVWQALNSDRSFDDMLFDNLQDAQEYLQQVIERVLREAES